MDMKITINAPRYNKPVEKPSMLMKPRKALPEPNPPLLPMVRACTNLTLPEEKTERVTIEERKPKERIKFALAQSKNSTFRVVPVPSTDNDKIGIFIESFSNTYRELASRIPNIKIDSEGLHIPSQDKVFMELVFTNKSFDQYITTNEEIAEYVEQQIGFTWYKANVTKKDDEVADFKPENTFIQDINLKYSPNKTLKPHEKLSDKTIRDFLELSKLMRDDEKVMIQFGFKPAERDWYKSAEDVVRNLSEKKKEKLSTYSKEKIGYSAFECCLRIICQTTSKIRSELIMRGYATALKQLEYDNKLNIREVKRKQVGKFLKNHVIARKIPTKLKFSNRFLLTYKEIAHFFILPNRSLQKDYELKVNEKGITIPHRSLMQSKGILMGHSDTKGKKVEIRIPTNNKDHLCGAYAFIGSKRMGKDVSCTRFIIENAKAGHGAIIGDAIDESGRGMADLIRQNLPEDRIVDIDLCDTKNPVYFGLDDVIEAIGEGGVDVVSNDLVQILDLDKNYSSKQLARLVAKACKCNLYDMSCFLKSEKVARKVQKQIKAEGDDLLALQLEHEYFKAKISANVTGAVINRLDEMLNMSIMKNLFAAPRNKAFDLQKFIEQNKVVLIRIKKAGGFGEMGTRVLMNMLLLKIFWLKKIKHTENVTFTVFNEFHQYDTEPFNKMLSDMLLESAKYRLGTCLIFHTPDKIDKVLWETIQAASTNFFMFKNTSLHVYRHLQDQLKPFDLETCMSTKKHESIYIPFVNGKQLEPIFVKMLPTDELDHHFKCNKHTAQYGTPISIVKKKVYETELSMYEEEEVE